MKIKAYTCPQCGAPLDVQEGQTFAECKSCGNKIQITYQSNEVVKPFGFVTPEGIAIASAYVPSGYENTAEYGSGWQSEMVPFTTAVRSTAPDHRIFMASYGKEIFHDIRNAFIKGMLAMLQTHTNNGYRKFTEPGEYFDSEAARIAGVPLTLVAEADLPSYLGKNPDAARNVLMNEIHSYEMFMGVSANITDSLTKSVLRKYEGKLNDKDVIVLAGWDYEGAEVTYNLLGFEMPEFTQNAINGIKDAFSGMLDGGLKSSADNFRSAVNDVVSGKEKMTMKEFLKGGGLVGMAKRKAEQNRAQQSVQQPASVERETDQQDLGFGHSKEKGKRVDHILYGVNRTYFCMFYADEENEATKNFLRFVASLQTDPSLAQREAQLINNKLAAIQQEAARNQAIAQQKQIQLQQSQAQLRQTLANNSAQMSDMIMDSWNKKMASDSRISQARSEAIMGVNTYQNSYGQNVQVSVSADHVYENRYGDVFGVSGTELDQSLLNDLNWTKIDK